MKIFKLLLPFFLIVGMLTAFSPSDTVKRDSTATALAKPFKVQNIAQTPETAKSYELITTLENRKKAIQERIDSVFNHLDSISTKKPTDTTRSSRKIVLHDRNRSIKSLSTGQHQYNKRSHNKEENQSGNIFAINSNTAAAGMPDPNQYAESKKQSFAENSHKRGHNHNIDINDFNNQIDGIFEKHFGIAHRRRSDDAWPVAFLEAKEQNRFLRNPDRKEPRVRQTAVYTGGTHKEIKLVS